MKNIILLFTLLTLAGCGAYNLFERGPKGIGNGDDPGSLGNGPNFDAEAVF